MAYCVSFSDNWTDTAAPPPFNGEWLIFIAILLPIIIYFSLLCLPMILFPMKLARISPFGYTRLVQGNHIGYKLVTFQPSLTFFLFQKEPQIIDYNVESSSILKASFSISKISFSLSIGCFIYYLFLSSTLSAYDSLSHDNFFEYRICEFLSSKDFTSVHMNAIYKPTNTSLRIPECSHKIWSRQEIQELEDHDISFRSQKDPPILCWVDNFVEKYELTQNSFNTVIYGIILFCISVFGVCIAFWCGRG